MFSNLLHSVMICIGLHFPLISQKLVWRPRVLQQVACHVTPDVDACSMLSFGIAGK